MSLGSVFLFSNKKCTSLSSVLVKHGAELTHLRFEEAESVDLHMFGARVLIVDLCDPIWLHQFLQNVQGLDELLLYVFVESEQEALQMLRLGVDGVFDSGTSQELFVLTLVNAVKRQFGVPRQFEFDFLGGGNGSDVISLDLAKFALDIHGVKVSLTKAEFAFMKCLHENEGLTISRNQLLDSLSDEANVHSPGTLDTLAYRLRKKIAKHYSNQYLVTVPGVGFRLESAK